MLADSGRSGQQVGLHQPGDVDIQRHGAFLVALAHHPDPAPGDVHVPHLQGQHLGRPQPGEQHQSPGDRPVPVRAETAPATPRSRPGPARGATAAVPAPAAGTRTSAGPGAPATRLAAPSSTGGPPPTSARVQQRRIPHRPEIEQPRDRRHPPVDRRRGIPGRPAGPHRHHVPTRLPGQHHGPAERQEPQQRIRCHPPTVKS